MRAATDAFPSAEDIVAACFQARDKFMKEAEREGVGHWEPPFALQRVRAVRCRWEGRSAATALCRFEEAYVPIDTSVPSDIPDTDWRDASARLAHVREGRNGWTHWVAPRGCAGF